MKESVAVDANTRSDRFFVAPCGSAFLLSGLLWLPNLWLVKLGKQCSSLPLFGSRNGFWFTFQSCDAPSLKKFVLAISRAFAVFATSKMICKT